MVRSSLPDPAPAWGWRTEDSSGAAPPRPPPDPPPGPPRQRQVPRRFLFASRKSPRSVSPHRINHTLGAPSCHAQHAAGLRLGGDAGFGVDDVRSRARLAGLLRVHDAAAAFAARSSCASSSLSTRARTLFRTCSWLTCLCGPSCACRSNYPQWLSRSLRPPSPSRPWRRPPSRRAR